MTAPVELLQQIGLSKYEAEAYYTLLAQGPLTGYEVGKRSQVPLSRSYEILERLQARGLAFVQPGDPPRYLAQDPARLLGQVRTTLETTLQALATELAALPARGAAGEFWVVRGRQPVLERARTMIAEARGELAIALPSVWQSTLAEALTLAHTRGCRVRTRLLDDG